MKNDVKLTEKKLRDFEEKIKTLKQLENELRSFDLKGLEPEAKADAIKKIEEINVKLKSPGKIPEIEKDITDLKEMIEASPLKNKLEKAILSISKRANEYDVSLGMPGREGLALSEYIKVTPENRDDIMCEIESLTTVINFLFGARGALRGAKPELTEDMPVASLISLGKLMYRLFLPYQIQTNVSQIRNPLIISSNDTELPWELMHDGNDFICIKNAIGRRIRTKERAKTTHYERKETLRFLLIANPTGDLEATEEEVAHIRSKLKNIDSEIIKGPEASNLRILDAFSSGNYDVIHYTGHAVFDAKNPDESCLILKDRKKIKAQEITRILAGRPLIFLNACSSGREMMHEGEISYTGSDTEGLASSFMLGGALSFIGALWPIYDTGSAEFASVFYERLLKGETIGESLRYARIHIKKSKPNDITWASFVQYGDPTLRLIEL